MRRREFIAGIGGAAAWPLVARAQQPGPMRRIGVLMNLAAADAEGEARMTAFVQTLQQLGWADGRNIRIDVRWAAGDAERYRNFADELVALSPNLVVGSNTSTTRELQRAARTLPIVFASATDPVGGGLVASLAQPGGNVTGFTAFEFGMTPKWLELLTEIAPDVKRAAVLRNPMTTGGVGQFGAIQAVAPSLGVELPRSTCGTPMRSSVPLPYSRKGQMAA